MQKGQKIKCVPFGQSKIISECYQIIIIIPQVKSEIIKNLHNVLFDETFRCVASHIEPLYIHVTTVLCIT